MASLTWNDVSGNEEGYPGDDDEEAGGEVVGDDVVRHVPRQDHLETRQADNDRASAMTIKDQF